MNMLPTNIRSAACAGKQGFAAYSHAGRVKKRMGKSTKKQNVLLSIYRCQFCALWHIGSRSKGQA